MCLAAAYKNTQDPENLMCRFVSTITFRDKKLILTDILGEEIEVDGELSTVDLVKNVVVVKCA